MARIEDIRPRMLRRGMLEMKPVTIKLAPKYDDLKGGHLSQLGFLGYLYELCNFSNGERTLAEIHRALGHELPPVPLEALYGMVRDCEALGYMAIEY
jgi:hypothetical protein